MKIIKKLVILGILGACLGIGFGFLGFIHPAFDTFSHFRLHLSIGLLVIGAIIAMREWQWISLLALCVGGIGFYSASNGTLLSKRILEADSSRPVYSLLHFNLYWINAKREAVIDNIIKLDPDLISLSEAATRWTFEIKRLDEKWPHLLHCPEFGIRGGIRFYSKWPLDKTSQYCGPHGSFARTQVKAPDGSEFTSGSVHLRWPWPASGPKQLRIITPELKKVSNDALFAGDFNATTWSYSLQRFAEASQMNIVPGIGPTWMIDQLPLRYTWWAGLPIDNVMTKGRIEVLSANTIEDMGSDHLPVMVKFQIK